MTDVTRLTLAEARDAVQGLQPKPWATDRGAALAALREADIARPAEVFWLTDGIQSPAPGTTEDTAARNLADALDALGKIGRAHV